MGACETQSTAQCRGRLFILLQQPEAPGRGCINTQPEPVHAQLHYFKHTCVVSQQTRSQRVGTVIISRKLGSKQTHPGRRYLYTNISVKAKAKITPQLFYCSKAQEA